ncbi:MAG: hypothetical protein H0X43_07665 [Nitrosospira sp.]|nr:hypothetical protein [Nitrosospira sp.]
MFHVIPGLHGIVAPIAHEFASVEATAAEVMQGAEGNRLQCQEGNEKRATPILS